MDKYGLKKALLLNGFFMILGMWIRCLINYNFWYVILGNAVSGIGLNIILTGSPMVSFHWFFPKNSPLITSILMMGQAFGFIISFWIPTYLTDFDHNA
jgi:MFS family permease